MRIAFRAGGLAVIAALTATVLAFGPHAPAPVAAAQPDDLPADLALVPADAAGFVHVRLADVWKNEVMDGFRKTWEKAGPKALAALDSQFVPAPSTISRGTAFVFLDDKMRPQAVGVLAFSASFDPMTVVKTYLPNNTTEKVNGKTVYRSPDAAFEFYFPDDKHIVIGAEGSLNAYLTKPVAKTGPLAAAIKLAGSGSKVVVASADLSGLPIPEEAYKDVPPDTRAVLKAKQLTLAVDLGADARFDVRATYADADAAQEAEKAVKAAAELGRQELAKMKKELEDKLHDPKIKAPRPGTELPEALATVFTLGAVARLDETLSDSKFITRDKTELAVAVPMPKEILTLVGGTVAMTAAALVPAAQKMRGSAAQIQSSNNLKQIALAMHSYHDANGVLPHDIVDKQGKPLLSWRVSLLPYLEQDNLYKQFKLDEAWDSDNNKKWSQTVVKVFLAPEANLPAKHEWGLTSYRGISGPGAAFEKGSKLTFVNFTDGTSNTVGVIETDELVPWAKPSDYPFDPKKPLPKIVPVGGKNRFHAAFMDGSVRALKATTPEKTLKALFTRAGGEIVPDLDK